MQETKDSQKNQNESQEKEPRLKPVVFTKGSYGNYYADDTWRQKLLLKAITVSNNPNDWRKMIGVKTMAEMYRTLDKLSMRKEYHTALTKNGIDFSFIVKGIKDACFADKDDTKLKAYQILLKSLGMEKYEEAAADSGKNWEELLTAASEADNAENKKDDNSNIIDMEEYEVAQPEIPEKIKIKQAEEKEIGKTLYE